MLIDTIKSDSRYYGEFRISLCWLHYNSTNFCCIYVVDVNCALNIEGPSSDGIRPWLLAGATPHVEIGSYRTTRITTKCRSNSVPRRQVSYLLFLFRWQLKDNVAVCITLLENLQSVHRNGFMTE